MEVGVIILRDFSIYELTKRPPGACQLDKGAVPPYNPLLLAWAFGALQAHYYNWGMLSEGNIAECWKVLTANQWRPSNQPFVALGPTIREQNCCMAGHNLDN